MNGKDLFGVGTLENNDERVKLALSAKKKNGDAIFNTPEAAKNAIKAVLGKDNLGRNTTRAEVRTEAGAVISPERGTSVDEIINAVQEGQWLPLSIVIARPFIEHLMMSAVMTVAGRDTGATLFGPAGEFR
jgi:hypothetical protein